MPSSRPSATPCSSHVTVERAAGHGPSSGSAFRSPADSAAGLLRDGQDRRYAISRPLTNHLVGGPAGSAGRRSRTARYGLTQGVPQPAPVRGRILKHDRCSTVVQPHDGPPSGVSRPVRQPAARRTGSSGASSAGEGAPGFPYAIGKFLGSVGSGKRMGKIAEDKADLRHVAGAESTIKSGRWPRELVYKRLRSVRGAGLGHPESRDPVGVVGHDLRQQVGPGAPPDTCMPCMPRRGRGRNP